MGEKMSFWNGNTSMGSKLAFLLGFLRRPDQVGSVVPSSRFLEKRIVDAAATSRANFVVELGPGTGGTTKAILDSMPREGKLLAIEINPDFVALLRSINDPRLIVHLGSAENIHEILELYDVACPDAVISGIPFSTIPPARGGHILDAVWSCLVPGGFFLAYQFRKQVAILGSKSFGEPETKMELFNVPPVRLFRWRKPVGQKGSDGT